MHFEKKSWKSNNLGQEMELAVYGHYGFVILLFPSISDDYQECQQEGLIDSIGSYITKGKCRVITIKSVNFESWLNEELPLEKRSKRHFDYNNYLLEELVPFIFSDCGGPIPIITCGAAIGAFHAANTYFRTPDIFYGVIAMSGTFNIEHFSKGYFDTNCYFNSPIHYLPNLNDSYWLSFLKSKKHIYIMSGSGVGEFPQNSLHLGDILASKGIPHMVDIWGQEWNHDWKTWNTMLPNILETKL